MEAVIVKQEEDWTYNFEGTEAELDIKTELDQDVDLQSACESTVPTLFTDSPTIKQEPTDSFEEAISSQENTICSEIVCDTTIVKEEDPVTEEAVQENDVWLQRLAREYGNPEESLRHDVKEEYDKDEETAVPHNTADRNHSIPVTAGSRKFVLVARSTKHALAAATNTHKEQARSQLAKVIVKVLEDKNSKIKSNLSYSLAQPPVVENVATSTLKPVLRNSNTIPESKDFRTAKPCMQPKQIQSPQRPGRYIVKRYHRTPDCIFQPKSKRKSSDIIKTNLKPAVNDVIPRSVTINRILDNSAAKNFTKLLMMTKNITPLVTKKCSNLPIVNNTLPLVRSSCNTSPLLRNSYNNSRVVSIDSTQTKEPTLTKQPQKLLNILETIKASKRAEAFKKVPRLPAGTNHRKSPVDNIGTTPPITAKINPTSVNTKIREILKYINSRLPQPIEAKPTLKPIRFINSIPTSQLEAFLRPCYVKLHRLKLLTCAVCRQQFYLKSHFVRHVFQHVRTPGLMATVPCKICGKYYQPKYLKIHERKEHGPKNFWCDHCGKKCPDKHSLIKHLICHSDTKLYPCDVCNKRFRTKSNLLSHQHVHSSDKPYHCIICDKRFSRKTSLSKHSLYHLAARPHQCKICYKQFCQLFHLERHVLVHTGERPYPCEICSMRFTRSSHRKRHMATHMSKKKYACEFCEMSFKYRSRLEKHKRVH